MQKFTFSLRAQSGNEYDDKRVKKLEILHFLEFSIKNIILKKR